MTDGFVLTGGLMAVFDNHDEYYDIENPPAPLAEGEEAPLPPPGESYAQILASELETLYEDTYD